MGGKPCLASLFGPQLLAIEAHCGTGPSLGCPRVPSFKPRPISTKARLDCAQRSNLLPQTGFQPSRSVVGRTVLHRRGDICLCRQARHCRALRARRLRRRPQRHHRPLRRVSARSPCSQAQLQKTPAQAFRRQVPYVGSQIPAPRRMLLHPNSVGRRHP